MSKHEKRMTKDDGKILFMTCFFVAVGSNIKQTKKVPSQLFSVCSNLQSVSPTIKIPLPGNKMEAEV